MKLSSIYITGMHNITDTKSYSLSDIAYLYGPNGSGKSTVLQAIQLAILGYIPGTDKNKTAIFTHSNSNFMSVKAVFDSGATILRTWEKTSKEIVASVKTIPEDLDIEAIIQDIELPIFNFGAFMDMTANKLKDWFINFLPKLGQDIDWNSVLAPARIKYNYTDQDIIEEANIVIAAPAESSIDTVRKFNEWCKEQVSINKADMTRIQSTIQSLIFYDDCDMSQSADDIKAEMQNKKIQRDVLMSKKTAVSRNETVKAQLASLTAQSSNLGNDEYVSYLDTKISEYNAEMYSLKQKIDIIAARKNELSYKYNSLKATVDKEGICPYTHSSCESIASLITKMKQEMSDINKEYTDLTAEAQSINEVLTHCQHEMGDMSVELSRITKLNTQYEMLQAQLDLSISDTSISDIDSQLAPIDNDINMLQDLLIKVEANNKYNSLMEQLTKDKYRAEQRMNIFKDWEKLSGVNGMQSELMKAPFEAFSGQISTYLTDFFGTDTKASFNVGEKANSFSFGLIRNGAYINFDLLSSGEKCLYTLSLMLCIIEWCASPIKMILIDDMLDHLDSDRINACFTTLYSSNVQTILAGVQKCEHPNSAEFVINVRKI